MQNEKVTIVVPIYNVEEYLPRCLDSILAQTYTNIEVMLVDDGSPDGAGAICDEYALRDARLRVFHIPNGGVAKARQLGVEQSTGEYIVFVDPDDWLPLDSVEVLYSNMSDGVDIVIGGYYHVCKDTVLKSFGNKILSAEKYCKALLTQGIYPAPWGKLYRKHIFGTESFPNYKKGQDLLMNMRIAAFNKNNIYISKHPVYYYNYERPNNTTNSICCNFEYELNFTNEIYNYYINAGLYDFFYNEIMNFSLLRIYEAIINGDHCDISHIWVTEVYSNTNLLSLPLRGKLTKIALVFPFLQTVLFYGKKVKQIIFR